MQQRFQWLLVAGLALSGAAGCDDDGGGEGTGDTGVAGQGGEGGVGGAGNEGGVGGAGNEGGVGGAGNEGGVGGVGGVGNEGGEGGVGGAGNEGGVGGAGNEGGEGGVGGAGNEGGVGGAGNEGGEGGIGGEGGVAGEGGMGGVAGEGGMGGVAGEGGMGGEGGVAGEGGEGGEGGGGPPDGSCAKPFGFTDIGDEIFLAEGVVSGDELTGTCSFPDAAGADTVLEFTAPTDGIWVFDTFAEGNDFDTLLHARTVCLDPATELACNDDTANPRPDAGGLNSEIALNLAAGESAFIVVDSFAGDAENPFVLTARRVEATAPTLDSARVVYNPTENQLGFELIGSDAEQDVESLAFTLLDAAGSPVLLDPTLPAELFAGFAQLGASVIYDGANGFVVEVGGVIELPENVVSVSVVAVDRYGLRSEARVAVIGEPDNLIPAGEACEPLDFFDVCAPGTRCLAGDGGVQTCTAISAPVIEEASVFYNAAADLVAIELFGVDAEGDVSRNIEVRFTLADGTTVPAPDQFFGLELTTLEIDGDVFLGSVAATTGFPSAPVTAFVRIYDDEGLPSALATVAVVAPPQVGRGETCDPTAAFNICADGDACYGPEANEPFVDPVCGGVNPPQLTAATAYRDGADFGFVVEGNDPDRNAFALSVLLTDAGGAPVSFIPGGGAPLPFEFLLNGVIHDENGDFYGQLALLDVVSGPCDDLGFDAFLDCLDAGGDFGACFDEYDAVFLACVDFAEAVLGTVTGAQVTAIDSSLTRGNTLTVAFDAPPANLEEGDYCLESGITGTCTGDLECLAGDEPLFTCIGVVTACNPERVVSDLTSVGPDGNGAFVFAGDTTGGETVLAGTCGGRGPANIFTFTAPSAGLWTLATSELAEDSDTVIFARSACELVQPELGCDDDFIDLDSSIDVALAEGQTIYVFVAAFNASSVGSYNLSARLAP